MRKKKKERKKEKKKENETEKKRKEVKLDDCKKKFLQFFTGNCRQ
jgi:hypothetical protein